MDAIRSAALRVLLKCCYQDLERILRCNAAPEEHLGLPVSVISLADQEPELAQALYARPLEVISILDDAMLQAQTEVKAMLERQFSEADQQGGRDACPPPLNVFDNVHVRLTGLPSSLDPRPSPLRPPLSRLGCTQLQQLLSVTGTVVRGSPVRMWESNQVYECTRCKGRFGLKCSVESGGAVDVPEACPIQRNPPCTGNKFKKVPDVSIYSGFQEIRLQAATACLGLGEPPASLTVVLQDELADSVRPGDSIEVVGVLVPHWLSTTPGQRCELELVLLANNVTVAAAAGRGRGRTELGLLPGQGAGQQLGDTPPLPLLSPGTALGGGGGCGGGGGGPRVTSELAALFEDFWAAHTDQPLLGRNKVLAGVCPGVTGLLPVKLAALLVLLGGVARREEGEGGAAIRGELHLLLVGDPGTGKSQLMKWCCQASPGRAVLTTGRGSSGAGLTVSAVREGNSWALEAGALVLADGGLCCIDEFDDIRPAERAVIHEAMEQQTVHVAKAGLVTSLSTRTAIIGATNPRPGTALTPSRPLSEMTGLEGPLLSRFDLVLLLADPRHPDWDRLVAGHVLARRSINAPASASGGSGASGTEHHEATWDNNDRPLLALAAPPPEPELVPDDGGLTAEHGSGWSSQAGQAAAASRGLRGDGDGSSGRMSIAQRVAARLAGGAAASCAAAREPAGSQASLRGAYSDPDGEQQGVPTPPGFTAGSGSSGGGPQGGRGPGGGSRGGGGSAWTVDIIRSYITWVRSRPPPIMSPEAERVLVSYYGAMRRAEERVAARSTIRALESLIRVSQAHARLVCSDRVLLRDAVVAVVLADSSTQLLHVPGGDNVTGARFPIDPDRELLMQQRVVLTALGLTSLLPQPPPMLPAPSE